MVSEESQALCHNSNAKTQPELVLEELFSWFQKHHIWFDKDKLKIKHSNCQPLPALAFSTEPEEIPIHTEGMSFSVLAKTDIPTDAIVCKIPKLAVLSWRTGGVSNILEDEEIAGAISLVLTLMYESQQGFKSPWYGYLQSLPEYVSLPSMWSEEELSLLEGVDSLSKAQKTRNDQIEDYSEIVVPLVKKYPEVFQKKFFSLNNFFRACSLVSSRAFHLDDYHGDSMIPLADMFNHRSGLEHVHFESSDACFECGEHGDCNHIMEEVSDEEGSLSDSCCEVLSSDFCFEPNSDDSCCESNSEASSISSHDMEASSSPPPGLDIITFKPYDPENEGRVAKQECPFNALGNDKECFDCDLFSGDPNANIEMRMVRDARAGEEVFNTYGQKSNESLLEKYGFAELENVDNYVYFPKEDVMEACADLCDLEPGEVDFRFNFWIKCWKILAPSLAEEENKDQEDDDDACIFCGLEHLSEESNHEVDERIITCPFSSEGPQEGQDESTYHRIRMARNKVFDEITPHLFRISHPGIPVLSFLTFLHIIFMNNAAILSLQNSQSPITIINYFSLAFGSFADHSDDKNEDVIQEPSSKRFKSSDSSPAESPIDLPEGICAPDETISDKISEALHYLIQPRLQGFPKVSLDETRLEIEEGLRDPQNANYRALYAKIVSYSERMLFQTCLLSLAIQPDTPESN
ncbi:hypothetical protein DSO57_1026946 [Entomophthora muscae]|uniref:Uncharacterized protein n=1 Tax=Entomophthora muscae TaxID=34485 RepID=A0ACC2T267_9FUNG|nr:hypothetical protein DSO57_1026946 [Entomophthora muscae]